MRKNLKAQSIMIAALAMSAGANASTTVIQLDFSGVGNEAQIGNFYNGGFDSAGNQGTDYGVVFSAELVGLEGVSFAGEPTPPSVMVLAAESGFLNIDAGFSQGLSFYYSNIDFAGQVDIYDNLDATGSLLGSLHLDELGLGPIPGSPYSNWQAVSLSFSGIAKSIRFSGEPEEIGFDNLTLGSLNPAIPAVPEPSSGIQLLLGAGLLALMRRYFIKRG